MKTDILYSIIFLAFIVYNFLSGTVYNKNQIWWYTIYYICLAITLIGLIVIEYDKEKFNFKLLLFVLFIVFGIVMLTWNMYFLSSDKRDTKTIDNLVDDHKKRTNWSTVLFLVAGIFAYLISDVIVGCSSSNDILCSINNIMIFIIANIGVYQFFNMLKLNNAWGFKTESSTEGNILLNVGVLTLWQIYMYFLAGGFKDSSIISKVKSHIYEDNYTGKSGEKTMYEFFSFISIFIIVVYLISNEVLIKNCKSTKEFDNMKNTIKNITWNMIGTTITTVTIIGVLN